MTPRPTQAIVPLCQKGTFNGPAAGASKFGMAPCVLDTGHDGPCDSGPAPDAPPPPAMRRAA